MTGPAGPLELRVVLTVEDFDAAVRLYRDVLGLRTDEAWDGPNGRGAILSAPRATLELLDAAQSGFVDTVEAGAPGVSGPVRIGVRVPDSDAAARDLLRAGADEVAAPVTTPWGHRNARLAVPPGIQLTLFTVPGDGPDGDAGEPGPAADQVRAGEPGAGESGAGKLPGVDR